MSARVLEDTKNLLRSSVEAIEQSRRRIEESDRLLSQYVALPESWRR